MRASFPEAGLQAEQPAPLLNRIQHRLAWYFFGALFRVLFRFRIENPPQIDGPFVVVANHSSFLDPIFVALAVRPRVIFLMTVLHYRSPKLGWFYRWSRAIPLAVRGAGNRGALRAAKSVLRRGEALAVFPEGGLTRDGQPLTGSPGAVSLVLSEGVPIVPLWLDGAFEAMPIGRGPRWFRPVVARFGEPVDREALVAGASGRREQLRVATAEVMERIASLGGHPSRERWLREHAGR